MFCFANRHKSLVWFTVLTILNKKKIPLAFSTCSKEFFPPDDWKKQLSSKRILQSNDHLVLLDQVLKPASSSLHVLLELPLVAHIYALVSSLQLTLEKASVGN